MQSQAYNHQQNSGENQWLFFPVRNPDARLRLYCFPYAGGNANVFRSWAEQLPDIEIAAIQYPGRASRFKEALIDSMEGMLQALEQALPDSLNDKKFAFFGHSMGASIAFEFTRLLQDRGYKLPEHLIVSGRRAPNFRSEAARTETWRLPKQEFLERLKELNGTPAELLEHQDLMDLMEPIIRNDFKLVETLHYREHDKLNVPLSVLAGKEDKHLGEENLSGWQDETLQKTQTMIFNGDHFYLHTEEQELLEKIQSILV